MYQTALCDASLFERIRVLDLDHAAAVRALGCHCGGKLHAARYWRKPRGGPEDLDQKQRLRESFCCAVDGCRRRVTPPALRFMGRKVFFSVWVLLLAALRNGPTPARVRRLCEHYPVSERTLRRWQRWWQEAVPKSATWGALRGRLAAPIAQSQLPGSLLLAFGRIADTSERIIAVLRSLLVPEAAFLLGERAW